MAGARRTSGDAAKTARWVPREYSKEGEETGPAQRKAILWDGEPVRMEKPCHDLTSADFKKHSRSPPTSYVLSSNQSGSCTFSSLCLVACSSSALHIPALSGPHFQVRLLMPPLL